MWAYNHASALDTGGLGLRLDSIAYLFVTINKNLYRQFVNYSSILLIFSQTRIYLGNNFVDLHTMTYFCVCVKRFAIACVLLLVVFLPALIRNTGEFGAKNYFTDHWTANTTQLFVSIKRKFLGPILFRTSRSEGEFPRGFLMNLET